MHMKNCALTAVLPVPRDYGPGRCRLRGLLLTGISLPWLVATAQAEPVRVDGSEANEQTAALWRSESVLHRARLPARHKVAERHLANAAQTVELATGRRASVGAHAPTTDISPQALTQRQGEKVLLARVLLAAAPDVTAQQHGGVVDDKAAVAPVANAPATTPSTDGSVAGPSTANPEPTKPVRLAQGDVPPVLPGSNVAGAATAPGGPAGAPGAPAGPPGAPGAPGAPGGPGMGPGGPPMPPLSVLLGYADLMIAVDRPYDAEKIYKGILAHIPKLDPNDPKTQAMMANMPKEMIAGMQHAATAAQQGLKDVEEAKKPTVTFLGHYYSDSHDVKLYAYGGGPTFRLPWGRATFTAGTGHYRNDNQENNPRNPLSLSPLVPSGADNDTLLKRTYNVLLEPFYKKYEGSFFISRVTYDAAPNRTLYDFRVSYVPNPPRERYTVSYGQHDSYFQNVNEQYFAPESYFQTVQKILYNDTSISAEYPLKPKIDIGGYYRHFHYTDGNARDNERFTLMYRLKPDKNKLMPVWRVGLDSIFDNSKFFTLLYSASMHFNVLSAATDYVYVSKSMKYGGYLSYPIAKQHFEPPAAAIGFVSKKITRHTELYAKVAVFEPPNKGVSISFRDYVLGINANW